MPCQRRKNSQVRLGWSSLRRAADVKDKLLDKSSGLISEFVSNLIPGDGTTEISLDLRENLDEFDKCLLNINDIETIK